MYCGGPTKDHILESACGGVALFDYDGDGLLDIYLVTGGELTPDASASLTGMRCIATSADGSSRTSRRRRAWTSPPGAAARASAMSMVTAVSISTSRTGDPNALFRNRGDGTFEDVAAARRRRGRRLEHRLHVLRRGRRRRSRPLRRALRRDDVGVSSCTRSGRSSGATGRTSWSGRPDFPASPICSSRTSATAGSSRRPTRTASSDPSRAYGFGVVATDYDDDGFVDLFVANDSNPNFLYHNLGNGRFESVGLAAGVARERRRRAPRPAWASTPATTMATGAWISCSRRSRTIATRSITTSTAGTSRMRARRRALPAPRSFAWAGAPPFSTPTSTGSSICSSPTATFSRTSTSTRSLAKRTARRTSCCLNLGDTIPRCLGTRGRRPADRPGRPRPGRRRSRQRRRSRPRRQQHGRRPDAAGESAGDEAPLGGGARRGRDRQSIRHRRKGDGQRRRHRRRCARSARAGASSRRTTCARTSGSATTQVPSTWRFACRADAAGNGNSFRPTGSRCSRCPDRPRLLEGRASPDEGPRASLPSGSSRGPVSRRLGRTRAGERSRYRPKLAVSESHAAVPEAARTGRRWVPAGASGQRARRAARASCPMRFAAAGPAAADVDERPARSRLPRRTAAARSRSRLRVRRALDVKRAKDLPRDLDARRSRVRRGTAAARRRSP